MRNVLTVLVILLLPAFASADAVYDRIIELRDSDGITTDQAAFYLAASAVRPDLLPAGIAGTGEIERCGTPAVIEAQRMLGQTSAEVGDGIVDMLARPTLSGPELTFNSPSGHFKIHYTTSGADATTLEYAQGIAGYADYSWQIEIDEMGYHAPPSDLGLGGANNYDIYVEAQGSLGYTSPDGIPDPTTPWNDSSSYIAIAPGLSPNLCAVTVAHEFCHASEMSFDVSEPVWFMENTSTWMEDEVYDDINDYWGYLTSGDNPLRKPWWDIREGQTSLYWYAGCIWDRYMELRIGVGSVLEVWDNCADVWGANMLTAQQDMFADHGMTWEQGFMEYACWRWFTGTANWYTGCGMFDDEATHWNPGPYIFPYHTVNTLPYSGDEGVYPPDTFGIHWIKVALANYQSNWINCHFDGRDGFDWDLGVILWDTAGNHDYYWYNCDASGVKDVAINAQGWDYVIFTPGLLTDTSLDKYYTINITATSGTEGGDTPDMIDLVLSDNPASSGSSAVFTLPTASAARLVVIDMSGRLVATLYDGEAPAGQSSVSLSGLATGNYFLQLYADGQIVGRRATVIR